MSLYAPHRPAQPEFREPPEVFSGIGELPASRVQHPKSSLQNPWTTGCRGSPVTQRACLDWRNPGVQLHQSAQPDVPGSGCEAGGQQAGSWTADGLDGRELLGDQEREFQRLHVVEARVAE